MSKIIIKDAVKKYGEKTVIKSVNLEIQDGGLQAGSLGLQAVERQHYLG